MEPEIPSTFIKIGDKNYKVSLDFEDAMGLVELVQRNLFLNNKTVLTMAENIELLEGFLTFIHATLTREYPNLTRTQLAEILTTENVLTVAGKICQMLLCAYSDRPEERNLNGCRPHLKLLKKENHHG